MPTKIDFIGGNTRRCLMTMALPMIAAMFLNMAYNLVDSLWIGNLLGETAYAALTNSTPIILILTSVAMGATNGVSILLSQAIGAKDKRKTESLIATSLIVAIAFSLLITLVLELTLPFILNALNTPTETYDMAYGYLAIYVLGYVAVYLYLYFTAVLRSFGNSMFQAAAMLVSTILNAILDPIFIFGLCGFPKMGVAGAALATITGQIIACLLALFFNLKFNHDIHFKFKRFRPNAHIVKQIYSVGIPSIIMQSIGSVMTFGMNTILITFSTTATAVFGVYFKLQSFVFMPVFGLNNGMIPIIAYNLGAKQKKRMFDTIKLAMIYATGMMIIGVIFFETIPQTLLGFFNASEAMIKIGTPALRIIAIHFIFAGFSIVCSATFQAVGKGTYSLLTSLIRQLLVLLPCAYVLSLTGNLDLIWLCFPIAEIFSAVTSFILMKRTRRHLEF